MRQCFLCMTKTQKCILVALNQPIPKIFNTLPNNLPPTPLYATTPRSARRSPIGSPTHSQEEPDKVHYHNQKFTRAGVAYAV